MFFLAATKILESIGFLEALSAIMIVAGVVALSSKIFQEIAENRLELKKISKLQEKVSLLENESLKFKYETNNLLRLLAAKHRHIDDRFNDVESYLSSATDFHVRKSSCSDSGADFLDEFK